MTRNYGIQSRQPSLRGVSAELPAYGSDTRADSICSSVLERPSASVRPNSDDFGRQLFILDERELGAGILFAGLVAAPLIIVFGLVFFYLAFVA